MLNIIMKYYTANGDHPSAGAIETTTTTNIILHNTWTFCIGNIYILVTFSSGSYSHIDWSPMILKYDSQ